MGEDCRILSLIGFRLRVFHLEAAVITNGMTPTSVSVWKQEVRWLLLLCCVCHLCWCQVLIKYGPWPSSSPGLKENFIFVFHRDRPQALKTQGFVLLHWLQQKHGIWGKSVFLFLPSVRLPPDSFHSQTGDTEEILGCELTPQSLYDLGHTCPLLLLLYAPTPNTHDT